MIVPSRLRRLCCGWVHRQHRVSLATAKGGPELDDRSPPQPAIHLTTEFSNNRIASVMKVRWQQRLASWDSGDGTQVTRRRRARVKDQQQTQPV